jgi:hypothetical protein
VTSYCVLREKITPRESQTTDLQDVWEVVGPPVESVSAEAAIRKAVDGDKGGTYVAVPVRSWNPIVVKVETTRVLKLAGVGV